MFDFKVRFALLSIRSKIITAFLFGCTVVIFSWVIARFVFKETFSTIEEISKPNPKLIVINTLFQQIQRLDYTQKLQVLNVNEHSFSSVLDESKPIIHLLDTLMIYCASDTFQVDRILRMQKILYERDELFLNYLKYRYGILKNNPLSKDIRKLSDYVASNIKKGDSNIVKTTRKNITTTTFVDAEEQGKKSVETSKKEPFFKRVFSRKKPKEEQAHTPVKLITENVQETVDTFALTQRDSFMKDMEQAIVSIEKDRSTRRTTLLNHELKLASASTIFIDELKQLLRQVQAEEISELQSNTESLSGVFNNAFYWVEIILCTFLFLILILILLIFSDISHSNKIKIQLVEAKEKAEYMEQVKHRFLANMSHEIRTPLQAILGYSELVKDQAKPEKHSLDAIYRSSEHLLQIVNEILDYSRIISGRFVFEKLDFDMEELIAEVADIMEGQAEKKNLLFKIRTDIAHPALYSGDGFRLKQILFNLIGNAIKFTDRGEISFLISSKENGPKKTEFIFEITDTGRGMNEEELKRIFYSFEQAGENIQREYGGTGLGLSIVKKLVEMQGGLISVQSEKQKGSSFKLHLSYIKSSKKINEESHPVLSAPLLYKGKVLVIDDDAFILRLCSTLLLKNGIAHTCYSSPVKALSDTWDPEVRKVLVDMRMPEMNGIGLYHLLKERAGADVEFIALTAQALPDEKDAILKEGFDKVLLKPFREKDLLSLFAEEVISEADHAALSENKFDLSLIEKMCMHDKPMIRQALELFVSETAPDLARFSAALEKGDRKVLAGLCHKLSSRAGQLGLAALAQKLRQEETALRKNANYVLLKKEWVQLAEELSKMTEDVKDHLAQI